MYFVKDFDHLGQLVIDINTTNHAIIWDQHILSTIDLKFVRGKIEINDQQLRKTLKTWKNYYLTHKYIVIINEDLRYSLALADVELSNSQIVITDKLQQELDSLVPYDCHEICAMTGYTYENLQHALRLSYDDIINMSFRIIELIRVFPTAQPIDILYKIKDACLQEDLLIDNLISKYSAIIEKVLLHNLDQYKNVIVDGFFQDIFNQIIDDVSDNEAILEAMSNYLSTVK